jgi:hypothetical protein
MPISSEKEDILLSNAVEAINQANSRVFRPQPLILASQSGSFGIEVTARLVKMAVQPPTKH